MFLIRTGNFLFFPPLLSIVKSSPKRARLNNKEESEQIIHLSESDKEEEVEKNVREDISDFWITLIKRNASDEINNFSLAVGTLDR